MRGPSARCANPTLAIHCPLKPSLERLAQRPCYEKVIERRGRPGPIGRRLWRRALPPLANCCRTGSGCTPTVVGASVRADRRMRFAPGVSVDFAYDRPLSTGSIRRPRVSARPTKTRSGRRAPLAPRRCAWRSEGLTHSRRDGRGSSSTFFPQISSPIRLLLFATVSAHGPLASLGLIWPRIGCASIASAATPMLPTFFPWADTAHSSRDKKVSAPASFACAAVRPGCVVDRPRPCDRHRGRGGRGLKDSQGQTQWPASVPSRKSAKSSRVRS